MGKDLPRPITGTIPDLCGYHGKSMKSGVGVIRPGLEEIAGADGRGTRLRSVPSPPEQSLDLMAEKTSLRAGLAWFFQDPVIMG